MGSINKSMIMKTLVGGFFLIIVGIIFSIYTGSLFNSRRVDWDYIINRGGIILNEPIIKKNVWYIPIECHAAGVYVTNEPKEFTSAPLYFNKAVVKIEDKNILFHLRETFNKKSTDINRLKIGKLKEGSYKIFYLNQNNKKVYIKTVNVTNL